MATTSPARIDDDLYASAKLAGEAQSRSASQQVAHWARIGREIEASASISQRDVAAVLAGSRSYDRLGPKEQAVVRAEWTARMDALRRELNLAEEFAAAGRSWVELDDDGHVVERRRAQKRTRAAAAVTKTRSARSAVKATRGRGAAERGRGGSAGTRGR